MTFSGKGAIRVQVTFDTRPEGKTAKNRIHLDVAVSAGDSTSEDGWARIEAHRDRLVAAGATAVEARSALGSRWIVLLDPEGNEFCVT